jgi:hypothetical protein
VNFAKKAPNGFKPKTKFVEKNSPTFIGSKGKDFGQMKKDQFKKFFNNM